MKQNKETVATGTLVRQAENRITHWLEKGPYPHITREEYQRVLAQTTAIELRLLFEVLWTTGSRVSETLSVVLVGEIRRSS